ncbi:MAG TPA: SUMF1/EgtB/PvdO family nonheme iron enzyme [Anaerolineae bacterium]|nr:SUMF1/EgtB/PvdO family nonheme iron enzyme [Anaerolineae bacterium]
MSEGNALKAFRDLPENEQARLAARLQATGLSLAELETLLRWVDASAQPLSEVSGGVNLDAQQVEVGRDVIGRDQIIQVIQLIGDHPSLQRPVYAALRASDPDLALDDYAALARRLRAQHKRGEPLEQAEREEPVYVPLPLKYSRHTRASPRAPFEHDLDFNDIVEAVQAPPPASRSEPFPALVLLGAPGGGKSTGLRHLALDRLNALLNDPAQHLPLFVSLGEYQDAALSRLRGALNEPDLPLTPLNFLRAHWQRWFGDDRFERALDAGRLWLILDGLNEIPDRVARVPDWIKFFDRDSGRFDPANRAVIACRKADYGDWLDLPTLEIKPLDPDRIRDFLEKRLKERLGRANLDDLQRRLEDDDDLMEVVSNPFWLKMLADYAGRRGALPAGRTELIDWFVDHWLAYGQGQRADIPVLSDADREALKQSLEPLAYGLLEQSDNAPVAWEEAEARCGAWGSRAKGDTLLRGELASLLVCERLGVERSVKFYHQLILEYFAGRELARRFRRDVPQAERWRIPWSNWSFVQSEWQRLSGPPTTRWEEATVFAAAQLQPLQTDPGAFDRFVRAVLAENPPLAARCLLESGGESQTGLKQEIVDRLLGNLAQVPEPAPGWPEEAPARLALRIAAGHALGKLGDPRILAGQGRVTIDDEAIACIEPIWRPVQAGPFVMGSDTSEYEDERPEHTCDVIKTNYAIGKFPVTNAEYECFVQARGYETEPYWTLQGWAWRQQDIATAQPPGWVFWWRDWARQNLEWIRQWPEQGRRSPADVKYYEAEAKKTDEQLIADWRRREINMGRSRNPWHTDRDLNGANQPVVGVCWHEAQAYCKWLTQVLRAAGRIQENQEVALPNEPEWEKAARAPSSPSPGEGSGARVYPWGDDFSPDRANTLDGRVLTTTPVGVYDNAGPCGAFDMSGNVWEWTRSRWGDDPQTPTFRYPYSENLDERERPDADDYRVVRGGSWGSGASLARCAFRGWNTPVDRYYATGFRCVLRSL